MKSEPHFIDPALTEPHFSTKIFKGYLLCLEQYLSSAEIENLVSKTGLSVDYLRNSQNWVSELFAERFCIEISKTPKLPSDVSFLAGTKTLSKELLGSYFSLVTSLIPPKYIYSQIDKYYQEFNRVDTVHISRLTDTTLVLELKIRRQSLFLNYIVENWEGFLSQVPTVYGLSPAKVKTTSLSDNKFEFTVSWSANHNILGNLKLLFSFATLIFLLCSAILNSLFPQPVLAFVNLIAVLSFSVWIIYLFFSFRKFQSELLSEHEIVKKEIYSKTKELSYKDKKLDRRYRETNFLKDSLSNLSTGVTKIELLNTYLQKLEARLGYKTFVFLETNFNGEYLDHWPKTDTVPNYLLNKMNLVLPVLERHTSVQKSLLTNLSVFPFEIVAFPQLTPCVFSRVELASKTYGYLYFSNDPNTESLTMDDQHLIENIANQLAVSLARIESIENEKTLLKTNMEKDFKLTSLQLETQYQMFVQDTLKSIAHDIRSPLAALKVLAKGTLTEKPEEARLMQDIITRISAIASQILEKDISNSRPSDVDLPTIQILVHNLIQEKTLHSPNVQFSLIDNDINPELYVFCVATDFIRILSNLINNSLEAFASKNSDCHIQVLFDFNSQKSELCVTVKDNGKGIPKEIISKIGTKGFSFSKSDSLLQGGNGLALYSAIETLNKWQGSLEFTSEENKGTQVTLKLRSYLKHS